MTMSAIAWGLAIAALLFWILPSLLSATLVFFGRRKRSLSYESYYAPYRDEAAHCTDFLKSLPAKRVFLNARDGTRLSSAWYDHGSDRTVIMLHGYNASALLNFCVSGKAFWDRNWNLLLVDQRAHGQSGGRFCGFGVLEQSDVLQWIDWVRAQTPSGKIAVYGVSMGCAAAAFASDKMDSSCVRAMVLDCGIVSPREPMIETAKQMHVPWQIMLPVIRIYIRLVRGVDINSKVTESLAHTKIPAIFLHGTADRTVPLSSGERSYAACAAEKLFIRVPDAEHTMAFVCADAQTREKIFAFIEKQLS